MKAIGIGVAVCIGIISGIYFGNLLVGEPNLPVVASNLPGDLGVPDELKLPFGPGDPFPSIQLETIQGDELQLQQHLYGKRTALLIAALECGPCVDFMNQWNQMVTPNLKSNTQEIVLISLADSSPLEELPDYLKGKIVFQIEREQLEVKYNIHNYPTAIAIDENGTVISIQYGQQYGVDDEILEFLTTFGI